MQKKYFFWLTFVIRTYYIGIMKKALDSVLPMVRVEKPVRKWLKEKAKRETRGNEGELIRQWVYEKREAEISAALAAKQEATS